MVKIGNSPPELNPDDVVTISYIVAKIHSKLCQIRNDYPNSRKYAEHVIKLFGHKKNVAGAFIISNFNDMQTNRLYKPSEIRSEMNRDMRPGTSDDNSDLAAALTPGSNMRPGTSDDISDLAAALTPGSEDGENECVTSKDITRALRMLEKDFGLIVKTTKKDIKDIKGEQKIEFSGRPSFYLLPPELENIKRIIAQPKAIEFIFKSLVKLGILPHLQFVCEAAFCAFREYIVKEQRYEVATTRIASKLVPDAKIDDSGWDSYKNLLLSLSEEQLKILANGVTQSMPNFPSVFRNIVLIALSKNT